MVRSTYVGINAAPALLKCSRCCTPGVSARARSTSIITLLSASALTSIAVATGLNPLGEPLPGFRLHGCIELVRRFVESGAHFVFYTGLEITRLQLLER